MRQGLGARRSEPRKQDILIVLPERLFSGFLKRPPRAYYRETLSLSLRASLSLECVDVGCLSTRTTVPPSGYTTATRFDGMTNHTLNSFRDTPLLNPDDSRDCTFCRIVDGSSPAHIVHSSPHAVAFLDILPIRAGHTLVITREHVGDLAKLSHGEAEVMRDLVKVVRGVGAGKPMHTRHNSAENLLNLAFRLHYL